MNIDFQSVANLPGVQHTFFGSGHPQHGAVYCSTVVLSKDCVLAIMWDIFTGNVRLINLYNNDKEHSHNFENVKTFSELKTLLSFVPLPYPETWP